MANRQLPSPEVLRQLLSYDPATGKLFWKERPAEMFSDRRLQSSWNNRFAGKEALSNKSGYGYLNGRLLYAHVLAHRVAWAIAYGRWPDQEIDHINGVRDDNRLTNLRQATRLQNMKNVSLSSSNTSGFKGAGFNKQAGKFRARIRADGREVHLGFYDTVEEAAAAYDRGAIKYHGQYAKPNNAP